METLDKPVQSETQIAVDESSKYFSSPYSEYIFYQFYSRWIPELGRRETWIEAIDRYMDYMKENMGDKVTDKEYSEVKEAILKQDICPSMRLLWSSGKACRQSNVWAYNCSYIVPTKPQDLGEIMYISMCGAGLGFAVEWDNVQKFPQIEKQIKIPKNEIPTHIVVDNKEGWADAFVIAMKTWYEGKDIKFDYSKIRPAGSRLETAGGKASGPQPLIELIDFTRRVMLSKQGRRLSNLDLHDIICKIGLIVVAGGVRRSALISLSELEDIEMRDAKKGQFYLNEPQRSMANNSAVYNQKPSAEEFLNEWTALVQSKSGERGIFNRGGLEKQVPARRWEAIKDEKQIGLNPCFPASERLLTSTGYNKFGDLFKSGSENLILTDNRITYEDNGKEKPENWKFDYSKNGVTKRQASPVVLTQKNVKIVKVETKEGYSVRCTPDHHIATKRGMVEAKDLVFGDEILIPLPQKNKESRSPETQNEKAALLMGLITGDGTFDRRGIAILDFWGEDAERMTKMCTKIIQELYDTEYEKGYKKRIGSWKNKKMSPYSINRRFDKIRIQSSWLFNYLNSQYGFNWNTKFNVPEMIYSEVFTSGKQYLAGLFYTDGGVQGNLVGGYSIRLAQSNKELLKEVQILLQANGIFSSIYSRRPERMTLLPDGKGGKKEYLTKENFELIISRGRSIFGKIIGFSGHPEKEKKIKEIRSTNYKQLNIAKFINVTEDGKEDVYCLKQDITRTLIVNGIAARRCGEIYLRSRQFCNLTSIVIRPDDTLATLKKKMELATLLGTYQSTLTNFGYLSKKWKDNCEDERLLGVSLTGYYDNDIIRSDRVLDILRTDAIEVNKKYAERFGINQSTAITCVKPHGNSGQLLGVGSGMHPWFAPYFIRRVRINHTDSLLKMARDQGVPCFPEVGQTESGAATYVLEFPVKAPEGAIFKDEVSALDLMHEWKRLKEHFVEHNPSATIYVGPDEWLAVGNFVYDNWDIVGGMSFLPRSEHIYQLAPYQEITKAEYERRTKAISKIDFSKLSNYENTDNTTGAKEFACVSGTCEI